MTDLLRRGQVGGGRPGPLRAEDLPRVPRPRPPPAVPHDAGVRAEPRPPPGAPAHCRLAGGLRSGPELHLQQTDVRPVQ